MATLLLDEWWDRHRKDDDALAPARGIMLGIVIGIALWLAIGLLVWWLV